MPYRNKTYVSFDGDNDIHYYWLMRAWKQSDMTSFNFYDAHDLNTASDTSLESSIKRQLADRLRNSKSFILLAGERTRFLYKFVRWEIEQAVTRDLPIIVVNLNGLRFMDESRCPPLLKSQLAVHVSFNAHIIEHALEDWTQQHLGFRYQGKTGPFYYREAVYQGLGL
ncbi:MAG: TIR domain-containing protein [Desulfurellaceae bacterium]|nr:TIR domain-containing protein [Desulfurellaceae bacterium]